MDKPSRQTRIVTIVHKLVDSNQQAWHKKLYGALWANRITPKRAINTSPFTLLYGTKAVFPITLELFALQRASTMEDEEFKDPIEKWMLYLMKLEEERVEVVDKITQHQERVKRIFYKKARQRDFEIGDKVLLWDKRHEPKGMHGNFDSLWLGLFQIHESAGENTYILSFKRKAPPAAMQRAISQTLQPSGGGVNFYLCFFVMS